MTLPPKTERALSLCYDAILAPETWAGALDELAHSLDAKACHIQPHDLTQHPFGIVRSSHAWRIHDRRKQMGWATPVYEPRGDRFVRRGDKAVIQSQLFSDHEISVSPFHQEITRPIGCLHWASGIFHVEDRVWCLPFFRATEPYPAGALEPIGEVAQHVARIISIAEKVALANAANQIITLERVGLAALLIDGKGRVAGVNSRAERLFCKDFCLRNGRLWAAGPAMLAHLDRFLQDLAASVAASRPLPSPVVLHRDRTAWLLIEPMPVTTASREMFDGCAAVLVISDLTETPKTDAALLCLVYGLTGAEARLAQAICQGQDLGTAAAAFGVTQNTVRDQLKSVFAKTGVRRQAELVARCAQMRSGVVN